jgi:hypothetical protein
MSIVLPKGQGFNAEFTSINYPVLDTNWTGSVSLYTTYPGTATFTKALTKVGNKFTLALTIGEILNLDAGVYSFVVTFSNTPLGIEINQLEYVTVSDTSAFTAPMTKLFITLSKSDATPAGKQTKSLTNTVNGAVVTLGWEGLTIKIRHPVAKAVSGVVIDTEVVTMQTNQAGYAEIYEIRGQTVIVDCPGIDRPIQVDTTGLDAVDLSAYHADTADTSKYFI